MFLCKALTEVGVLNAHHQGLEEVLDRGQCAASQCDLSDVSIGGSKERLNVVKAEDGRLPGFSCTSREHAWCCSVDQEALACSTRRSGT